MATRYKSLGLQTPMAQRDFWSGFAAGATIALSGLWACGLLGRGGGSRIIRLEKSVQIGRPVHEIFAAWSDLNRIPQFTDVIQSVRVSGNRSKWTAMIAGRTLEWDAELVQVIPNQVLGWKTLGGIRHTGRLVFSPIADDTVMHVHMNYVPPARAFRPLFSPITGQMEGYIERVLRDFKAYIEAASTAKRTHAATGTYGPELASPKENREFGPPGTPVEYTRPTEPTFMNSRQNK